MRKTLIPKNKKGSIISRQQGGPAYAEQRGLTDITPKAPFAPSKLPYKSKIQSGSWNGTKQMTIDGQAKTVNGFFSGSRTINRYKDKSIPNDTIYNYTGQTPYKTEIFNYSTSKQAPINQLDFNGKISPVSPDSVKMFRERVNNLARILPPKRW